MRRSEAKQALVDERKAFNRRRFRCFWAWPWGHQRQWVGWTYGGKRIMRCVECEDEVYAL